MFDLRSHRSFVTAKAAVKYELRVERKETHAKSKLEPHGGKKGKKVLGLAWDCEDDTLHFNFQHKASKAICYM